MGLNIFKNLFSGGIGDIEKGAADIIGKFVADPNQKAQLTEEIQKLVIDQQNKLADIAEAELEAQFKDMADARAREVSIANSDKAPLLNKIMLPILAAFVTLGFFGLLGYMLKYDVPAGNKDILNIMLGSLGTAWLAIVYYYFGSSSGSKDKDETIKKLSS